MIKLNIGCGKKYKKGYINIDFKENPIADEVMHPYSLRFEDESVDLVEAYYLIENIGYVNAILVLGEVFRILAPKSSLIIETIDVDKVFYDYLNCSEEDKHTMLSLMLGQQDKNKFYFPLSLFKRIFFEAGFDDYIEKFHDKIDGISTYAVIVKKPVDVNNKLILVNNFRKRCFTDIPTLFNNMTYKMLNDFEIINLGYRNSILPRDFSQIDFNKLLSSTIIYNFEAAKILIEEALKLEIIEKTREQELLEKIEILEKLSFRLFLFSTFIKKLGKYNSPDMAFNKTFELGKDLVKEIILGSKIVDNPFTFEEINDNILYEDTFSYYLIEEKLTNIFAKCIKGVASQAEYDLCSFLTE